MPAKKSLSRNNTGKPSRNVPCSRSVGSLAWPPCSISFVSARTRQVSWSQLVIPHIRHDQQSFVAYEHDAIEKDVMKLLPLHNFVLVKRLEEEHKTASGILIPVAAAEKPDRGEVIAASAGTRLKDGSLRALDVKVGDRVLFEKFAGQPVKIDDDDLLVMREEDIIGVVEGWAELG